MSVTFSITRDEIIKYALQQCGAIGEGDTPTTTQYTESAWLLNVIVKAWAADGMPLWDIKTGYILPTTGTSSVSLGANSANSVASYVKTVTTAAAIASATTILVSSITGISSGDYIGIELSDSTMFWTTVNGAPSGSTITLTSGLTTSASSGAQVYTYTSTNRITRPLRITDAYIINSAGSTIMRYPINVITKDQYFSLGGPENASVPNQVYYDPQLGSGTFYIYPRFLTGDNLIQITYQKEFDDFNSSSDTPDFPQEFYLPMMYELAAVMGPKYGLPAQERAALFKEATYYRELALSNGTEQGSFFFQPDYRWVWANK